eukprot:Opistho-2@26675
MAAKGAVGATADEMDGYYLEQVSIAGDSDDEFAYAEVAVEDGLLSESSEGEEDLDYMMRTLTERTADKESKDRTKGDASKDELPVAKASVSKRPETVEDYVRNYLARMGLERTLDSFQCEWYEFAQTGRLPAGHVADGPVDVYQHNQQLTETVKQLQGEVLRGHDIATRSASKCEKMRKERDFHRMHHMRVVQEKNTVAAEVKRLEKQLSSVEPTLRSLRQKYEAAMREKMLAKLDRDRLNGRLSGLEAALRQAGIPVEGLTDTDFRAASTGFAALPSKGSDRALSTHSLAGGNVALDGTRVLAVGSSTSVDAQETSAVVLHRPQPPSVPRPEKAEKAEKAGSVAAEFPADDRPSHSRNDAQQAPMRAWEYILTTTIPAHSSAVTALAVHPKRPVVATGGNDKTWKLWTIPSGELIAASEGHREWVSHLEFSPNGNQLATASGDCTVKLWEVTRGTCLATFTDHKLPVWACAFHDQGEFLASASMDQTVQIWDLQSQRSRSVLRDHADSVATVAFRPFSNVLASGSADKTIKIWDPRSSQPIATLLGHDAAVNSVVFDSKGENLFSADASGTIKVWDARTFLEHATTDFGPHPANRLAIDPSGQVVAVAVNDGTIALWETPDKYYALQAHEGPTQAVAYARNAAGDYLISGGADGTVRLWS